jgi:hypothetical protein
MNRRDEQYVQTLGEQARTPRCHHIESGAELGYLRRSIFRRPRRKLATGESARDASQTIDRRGNRPADEERSGVCNGRRGARDGKDDDAGAYI